MATKNKNPKKMQQSPRLVDTIIASPDSKIPAAQEKHLEATEHDIIIPAKVTNLDSVSKSNATAPQVAAAHSSDTKSSSSGSQQAEDKSKSPDDKKIFSPHYINLLNYPVSASLNIFNMHSVLLKDSVDDISSGIGAIMQKNASLGKEFLRCKTASDLAEMQKKSCAQGINNAQELFVVFSEAMRNCSAKTIENISKNFEHIFARSQ